MKLPVMLLHQPGQDKASRELRGYIGSDRLLFFGGHCFVDQHLQIGVSQVFGPKLATGPDFPNMTTRAKEVVISLFYPTKVSPIEVFVWNHLQIHDHPPNNHLGGGGRVNR